MMKTIEEIEQAILDLSKEDLALFLEWFEEYHARLRENQVEEQYPLRGMPFQYSEPFDGAANEDWTALH